MHGTLSIQTKYIYVLYAYIYLLYPIFKQGFTNKHTTSAKYVFDTS